VQNPLCSFLNSYNIASGEVRAVLSVDEKSSGCELGGLAQCPDVQVC
jgi:hypothetical protein